MTKIDFFSNAPNRLEYVTRLLKKVLAAQQKAVVFAPANTLSQLSDALWQLDGFCAHDVIDPNAVEPLVAPIILTSTAPAHLPHYEVLINLSDELPSFFAAFLRLIEVVPAQDEPKQKARERWAHYKSRGYPLTHFDIAKK